MLLLWVKLGKLCRRDHSGEGREVLWPEPAAPVCWALCRQAPTVLMAPQDHPAPSLSIPSQQLLSTTGWAQGWRGETPTRKNEKKKKKEEDRLAAIFWRNALVGWVDPPGFGSILHPQKQSTQIYQHRWSGESLAVATMAHQSQIPNLCSAYTLNPLFISLVT